MTITPFVLELQHCNAATDSMETTIISINKTVGNDKQVMTSLEIAQVTGKQHKNVMQAIRNMESAWEKVNGLKFQLVNYKDQKGELRPCYSKRKGEAPMGSLLVVNPVCQQTRNPCIRCGGR